MITKIPFKETSILSKLAANYTESPRDFSYFISAPPSLESIKELMVSKKEINRDVLVNALTNQNKKSNTNSLKNIELLRKKNTFTVTTGHQICLFTGPLYSIYKIISTINLAATLQKKYPKNKFIPVFWMATEDHDFEEINHIHLGTKTITWDTPQKGPVGRFSTEDIQPFLDTIKKSVDSDLTKKISAFYSQSSTLSEAHRKTIDFLFGEYGVVILDADSKELKKEMIPIFKNEILESKTFEEVNKTSEKLIAKGYKAQVTPRKINLFYQENGLRERIVKQNNLYSVLNTEIQFTEKEILTELETFPEKFSPNVVMRPIYQEKILPNLAYIGGPGELAYWLQLKQGFETHQVDFPMLVLRNSALLIPSFIKKKINKLPFELKDYFDSEENLINRYIQKISSIYFKVELKKMEQIFETIKEKASGVDFSLERTVQSELKKSQTSIYKIHKKVRRAEKHRNKIEVERIKTIKSSFFPNHSFQERHANILDFYEEDILKKLTDNLINLEDNITLIEI